MNDYIVDSFAGVLTKGDVLALYNELEDHYRGNRSKAAREIGVTPTTTYGWKDANYIKHDTKKKVLRAVLECRYLTAIEYLLNRTSDKQTDILRTMLMDLFTEAITADTPASFREAYNKYEKIRTHFRGTIRDHIEEEVAEMSQSIEARAKELGENVFEPSIDELTAKDLVDTLPLIVMEYRNNMGNPAVAAKNLRLPVGSIHTLWSTFSSMRTPQPLKRDVESRDVYLGYGGLIGFLGHSRPRESYRQLLKIIPSPLGTVVVTRPSDVQMGYYEGCLEDASTYCEIKPSLPTGQVVAYCT